MKILVTGGAGYIGSHICKELKKNGFDPIVFDNLSNGFKKFVKWGRFIKGDLKKIADFKKIKKIKFKGVIHLASNIEVGESYKDPTKFYLNNVTGSINLLEFIRLNKIKNFIFSSTAAVYGELKDNSKAIKENFHKEPISPYGKSKLFVERILEDYSDIYGINFCIFRYFNASGADSDVEIGESHTPETHLVPNVINACEMNKLVKVFGKNYRTNDGTCMRDYVHVSDLAEAHVKGLKKLIKNNLKKKNYFNLGSGKTYSVLEVINAVSNYKKKKVRFKYVKNRFGDPSILMSNIDRAKMILNWTPKRSNIENIVKTSYQWYLKNKI